MCSLSDFDAERSRIKKEKKDKKEKGSNLKKISLSLRKVCTAYTHAHSHKFI